MKKAKVLALLLAVLMITGLLAACNNDTPASTTTPASSGSTPPSDGGSAASGGDVEEWAELSGTVTVSIMIGGGLQEGLTAVADAYMEINPGVKVVIDLKPGDGYGDWLSAILATTDPITDIVNTGALVSPRGSYIDHTGYYVEINPYTGMPWMDGFTNGDRFNLDGISDQVGVATESFQVLWYYNIDMLEAHGLSAPQTWDELIHACEVLYEDGIQPMGFGGVQSNWVWGQMGWLVIAMSDQVARDWINITRAQPGDWNYDPDIDGIWKYDPMDPWNDAPGIVTDNWTRFYKAFFDGDINVGDDRYKFWMSELHKVFPKYSGGEAFWGTDFWGAFLLFQKEEAAFFNHFTSFIPYMMGVNDDGDPIVPFRVGSMKVPSLTGPYAQGPSRTSEGEGSGVYMGAINKSKEQNDLVMDFIMYFTSPQGYSIFLNAAIPAGYDVSGSPLIKGVELPPNLKEVFEGIELLGDAGGSNGGRMGRGVPSDVQESLRDWYTYTYEYLVGNIDIDEWGRRNQANAETYMPSAMPGMGVGFSDLDNPQNRPTGQ